MLCTVRQLWDHEHTARCVCVCVCVCSTAYCKPLCVCRENLIATPYSFITKRGLCNNNNNNNNNNTFSSIHKQLIKHAMCSLFCVWLAPTYYSQKNCVCVCRYIHTYIHTCIGNSTFQISIHINKLANFLLQHYVYLYKNLHSGFYKEKFIY